MKTITKILDEISKYFGWISMATMAIMMAIMVSGVIGRLLFNNPIKGSYEICMMLLTMLIFGSFAYTQTKKGHVHVTMLISHLPHKIRFIFFGFTSILSAVVMGMASYAALLQGQKVLSDRLTTGILHIPHYPFFFYQSATLLLFCIVLTVDALKAVLAIFSHEYAEEVTSSWV